MRRVEKRIFKESFTRGEVVGHHQYPVDEAVKIDRELRTMPDGPERDKKTDELIGLELRMLDANQMKHYRERRVESNTSIPHLRNL